MSRAAVIVSRAAIALLLSAILGILAWGQPMPDSRPRPRIDLGSPAKVYRAPLGTLFNVTDLRICMDRYYGPGQWQNWTATGTGTDIGPAINQCLINIIAAGSRGAIWVSPGIWAYKTLIPTANLSGNYLLGAGSQASKIVVANGFTGTICIYCFSGSAGRTGGGIRSITNFLEAGMGTTTLDFIDLIGNATFQPDQMEFDDLYITALSGAPTSYYAACFTVDGSARTSPQGVRVNTWNNIQCFNDSVGSILKNAAQINISNLGFYTGTGNGMDLHITGGGSASTNSVQVDCRLCTVGGTLFVDNASQVSFSGTATNVTLAPTASGVAGFIISTNPPTGSLSGSCQLIINAASVPGCQFPLGATTGLAAGGL